MFNSCQFEKSLFFLIRIAYDVLKKIKFLYVYNPGEQKSNRFIYKIYILENYYNIYILENQILYIIKFIKNIYTNYQNQRQKKYSGADPTENNNYNHLKH